ncbi:MAG: DUF4445 domain-containing protein [Clostridia bacterium]|nr:DUF4445 domain-containing protein [Clostridia bacterium]
MSVLTVIQQGKTEQIPFEGSVSLSDLLARHGYFVPHPCGGRGTCKKCTVTLDGSPVLACRQTISADGTVILPDRETIFSVTGGAEIGRLTEHSCLCLDIGTTTLALALVSLDEHRIIRTVTAPNPQRAFGADVISRIDYCMKQGASELQKVLLEEVQRLISLLLSDFGLSSVKKLYVAGNTTMLHLFFGVDCSSLGVSPYTPVFLDRRCAAADTLPLLGVDEVISLPGFSAFVGADISAGIDYVGKPTADRYRVLLDLGTNAEIALFNGEKILCTAAAAGPCFEGANISCGMSASEGAVCACAPDGSVTVIGGGEAKGMCATGLIDAIAEGVRREDIDETGFLEEDPMPICGDVVLTGKDIREFQLAKSAIRAATECLLRRVGISYDDVEGLYVAGGFSAGLNVKNAAFVGLIPEELADKMNGINNASLLGTVHYACSDGEDVFLPPAEYADLSADPMFSDLFMEYMMF